MGLFTGYKTCKGYVLHASIFNSKEVRVDLIIDKRILKNIFSEKLAPNEITQEVLHKLRSQLIRLNIGEIRVKSKKNELEKEELKNKVIELKKLKKMEKQAA